MKTKEKKPEKPQLHVSGLEMLAKCGEQFRRAYIERDRIPPGIAAIVGRSTHRSVEKNLRAKIETGNLLPLEEIQDIARDTLVNEWQGGVFINSDEAALGTKIARAGAIDKAVRLSALHAIRTAPTLKPTHVERRWVIELPGFPVDLAGILDIQEGTVSIRDTKTTGKAPAKDLVHSSIQLTCYAMAVKVLDGQIPEKVYFDYLVDSASPEAITYDSVRDEEDFQVLLRRVENAVLAMEKGIFVPAKSTDFLCSPRWCGFHASCRFTKHPKLISVPY